MIRTVIVDDEPLALDILESYIAKIPEIELVARCINALEANAIIKSERVDLMFLDIQMPQISGVEFLKTLPNPPAVVLTTAYPDYALEGYELNIIDFLLKPISFDRFVKAVNKASEKLKRHSSENVKSDLQEDFFFIKADKKLVKVKFDDIIYIEGLKDYVIIRCEQNRIITLQTMKSLEDKLPSALFKRVHRSFIVNLDKITALDGNILEVMEKGQTKILPIGKNYKDDLLELIHGKKL